MQKTNFYQDADSLIQGIDAIILKNRCSFSDEELQLLHDCKIALSEFRTVEKGVKPDLNLLVRVFEVLSRVFLTVNEIYDVF